MVKTTIVQMTPTEQTSDGLLKIKEWKQPMLFRFLPHEDFRGTLKSVEWNLKDNVKHCLTDKDEDFELFEQVGERPEINVSSSWLEGLGLDGSQVLRIKFTFDTFRQEPSWYAHLYIKDAYGDQKPPYSVETTKNKCKCCLCKNNQLTSN